MLNKKDPLIDAIQQVMQNNQTDRDAVKAVNEKFGIQDRRVLPRERQGEWDTAYQTVLSEEMSSKQKQLAAVGKNVDPDDNPKTIGRADLKAASMGHASHIKEADAIKLPYLQKKGDKPKLEPMPNAPMKPAVDWKTKAKKLEEEEKMKGDDPCWKNYKMVGMKKKGGKPVPNCVPVKEQMTDPYAEGQASSITTVKPKTSAPAEPKPVNKGDQSKLKNMIMSIKEAKKAAMCEDTLDEKITKSMPAGKVISDFVHSDNPKFAGKSKEKRTQMALGAYYSKHPEKSKKLEEATLESIQEEIANNLAEQAAYIFENEGQESLDVFLESLTEEQFELLQLHEKAAGGYVEYMQKKNKDAAAAAKTKETTAKLNAPGAKGPNAAAGPSPAQPQVAAKKTRTSDAISKMNADVSAKNKTTTVKPKPKPAAPAPKAAAPKAAAPKAAAPAAPVKKSTPAQRAQINRRAERDSIGPSGKPRQLQGLGVKTGTTIKKRPIGMGREK